MSTLGEALDDLCNRANEVRDSLPWFARWLVPKSDPAKMRFELLEHGLSQGGLTEGQPGDVKMRRVQDCPNGHP